MKPMRSTKPGSVPTRLLDAVRTAGAAGLTRPALQAMAEGGREATLRDDLSRLVSAGKVFATGSHKNRRWFWCEADALVWEANRPPTQHEFRAARRSSTEAQKAARKAAHMAKLAEPRGHQNAWTLDQILMLRALFPDHGTHLVAERTGRSRGAVQAMAARLGLKRLDGRGSRCGPQKRVRTSTARAVSPGPIETRSAARATKQPAPMRPIPKTRPGGAQVAKPRGPADMPGEPIFTERTKWTIAPPPPNPSRTNTYSLL